MKNIITVIVILFIVFLINYAFSFRDDRLMQNNYCHTVNDNGEVIAWQC